MTGLDAAAKAVRAVLPHLTRDEAITAAETTLLTLRTPTRGMVRAAAKIMTYEHRPDVERVSNSRKHALRWQAMIDAALGRDIPNLREKP